MSDPIENIPPEPSRPQNSGLLQSGVVFTGISFLSLLIHWLFQFIISPQLGGSNGEFGLFLATIAFIQFLSIPLPIAVQAVTHYIARFHFSGDDSRLHGLLAGCRKFLFHITVAGSVVAIILVRPLGDYFNIPRTSLTLIALTCVLGNLWSSYATALCQGLGWFKRLALIGLLCAIVRVLFGWPATKIWPVAELAVMASTVMLLPNLLLLLWKNEIPPRTGAVISPWTPEFVQFLVVSAAYSVGMNFFANGDLLVAKKYFPDIQMDAYASAGLLARNLPVAAAPLLIVLFTHRSRRHAQDHGLAEQLRLIGIYAAGLILGAVCLYELRGFCLQLLHRNTPAAVAMIGPLSITMVFVGLLQAIALWALASRWTRISLCYGVFGLGYWILLLIAGKTPSDLLRIMPVATGIAFGILLILWFLSARSAPQKGP